ncbi:MAG: hypothetical protein MAG794_00723 [Gammaproteobacteria bacterium]|nr:hypothetical protein [Gammaproteobacteria bacterium]
MQMKMSRQFGMRKQIGDTTLIGKGKWKLFQERKRCKGLAKD